MNIGLRYRPHMGEVEHSTVVDCAIHALREAIRTGKLEPGQRLIVADISRMLNVSGGPVREAIRRLTGEGLVQIVPHRGASVRKVSSSEIKELFELREAVEGLAARLACGYAPHGPSAGKWTCLSDALRNIVMRQRPHHWEHLLVRQHVR